MDINQLNIFITAAQYLNFTEAAKHLYVAQSAISYNIAELEKELEIKLFFRNKGSISLTPAGEVLLKEAFKITSLVDETALKMKMMSAGASGELSVGFVFVPIVDCIAGCFKSFHEKYLNINVTYNSYDSITMSRLLENKELDIAFCRPVTINNKNDISWRFLYSDPLYIIVPPDHRLAQHEKVSLDIILHEPIVLMDRGVNPGMFDMIHHLYMSAGVSPKVIAKTNDLIATVLLSEIGMGMCILPEQFRRYVPEDMLCILIDDENARHDIGVAWRKDSINPAIQLFIDELNMFVQKNKAACGRPG